MLRESSSLTNHSLESFINEATHSSQAFYLHELLEHPKLDTISQAHRKILELFIYGTYLTWNSAEIGLDKNQIHQLKRITILQMMDGKQEIQINEIISKLELSKIEVYKILTQMNIQGVISIKINQKTGKCAILSAHSRLKSGLDERIPQFQAKLQKIYAKNKDYLGVLNKAGDSSKKRKFLFEQDD